MRTTVDLPDRLHEIAKSIAHDRSQTFSEAVSDLMQRGLGRTEADPEITRDPLTGWPTMRVGRTITIEDVRRLEDEV
ncbi:MAG: hypothetical protein ACRDPW_05090 [Mycobacteriales bacterium]